MRGRPDERWGAGTPQADVEALVAWGRFTDAAEALQRLDQALPALESTGDAGAVLLALAGRAQLARIAGRPLPEVVEACGRLERAALDRRDGVWAACAAALRARARLDTGAAGDVANAVTDLARVDLGRLGAGLAGRPGLLLLDTLAGAYVRLRLDERAEEARGRFEQALPAATPLDRAAHWAGWSLQLLARALDPVAAGRGEPEQALLERALAVGGRIDGLPPASVPDPVRRAVQAVRALAAAYAGRPAEALRLLGRDAFGEARDLPPLARQVAALAAVHAHALVGSVATARSLDDAVAPAPAGLPHLVLDACRARDRVWLENHAGGSVVPALTRLDAVVARIGWLGLDLVAQTARQLLEQQTLRVESRTDPLTGAGNRRALEEEMRHMLRFTPMPLALVLVDIDDFKGVNDAFGHVVGDEVLRRVAGSLRGQLRPGDHLARYGGDEFIVLLPGRGEVEAREMAGRMAGAIARLPWGEVADGVRVRVTTGAAALWSLTGRRPDRDAESLFRRADEALLEAKRGRAPTRGPGAVAPAPIIPPATTTAPPPLERPAAAASPPPPAVAATQEAGATPSGPDTAPVTVPLRARAGRGGHHAQPAHSLQADDADDAFASPPDGIPQTRRRR